MSGFDHRDTFLSKHPFCDTIRNLFDSHRAHTTAKWKIIQKSPYFTGLFLFDKNKQKGILKQLNFKNSLLTGKRSYNIMNLPRWDSGDF